MNALRVVPRVAVCASEFGRVDNANHNVIPQLKQCDGHASATSLEATEEKKIEKIDSQLLQPLTLEKKSDIVGSHMYEKVRDLGTGSFGKAILVKEKGRGEKLYAMKVIETALLGPKERRDAINEVQVLSSLKHPYIISYKESFIEEGHVCIVMDYADGGDLFRTISHQRKRRAKGFPEEQILRWVTQATLALKYLHDKHILHRDLKSQNLFLMSNGRLRLGDFGIAKVLDGTAAFAKTQIGTPYFLSPEICKNKPYSWAADIWSLGCILHELATLRVPFDAQNFSVLLDKITRYPPPPLPDHYSAGLRKLYNDCMQRDWQKRPSASDILLRDVIQNEIRRMLLEEQQKRRKPLNLLNPIPSLSQQSSISISSVSLENDNRSDREHAVSPRQNISLVKQMMPDSAKRREKVNSMNPSQGFKRISIPGDTEIPTPPPIHARSKVNSKDGIMWPDPLTVVGRANISTSATPEKPQSRRASGTFKSDLSIKPNPSEKNFDVTKNYQRRVSPQLCSQSTMAEDTNTQSSLDSKFERRNTQTSVDEVQSSRKISKATAIRIIPSHEDPIIDRGRSGQHLTLQRKKVGSKHHLCPPKFNERNVLNGSGRSLSSHSSNLSQKSGSRLSFGQSGASSASSLMNSSRPLKQGTKLSTPKTTISTNRLNWIRKFPRFAKDLRRCQTPNLNINEI